MKHGKLLTQDEVNALPDGARVLITWSGGNGPHEYVLRKQGDWKEPFAYTGEGNRVEFIDFVGQERYHTHVSLVSEASENES